MFLEATSADFLANWVVLVGISLVLRIFLLAYLVFSIWILRLFLMPGVSIVGFLFLLFVFGYSCVFIFTFRDFFSVPLLLYSFYFLIYITSRGLA